MGMAVGPCEAREAVSTATVTRIAWSSWLSQDRALDPYLIWADNTAFAAFGPPDLQAPIPFVLESRAGALSAPGLPAPLRDVSVAKRYRAIASAYPEQGSFFTALVNLADIGALVSAEALIPRFQLSLARWGAPLPLGSGSPVRTPQPMPKLRKTAAPRSARSTVIGIIDDGCPFAHPNLSDTAGRPRVKHLWDKGDDVVGVGLGSVPWVEPPGFIGGREIHGDALAAYSAVFGERKVYPAVGIDRISGRSRTHGNGICHLAAGRRVPVDLDGRRFTEDAASALPIVFVQLPLTTVADTTGGSIGFHVLEAMHYIHERASDIATAEDSGTPQVIVNLSYGSSAGPHDGTSLVERALVAFLKGHPNVSLVVAAGNSNRDSSHVEITLPAHSAETIDVLINPDHPLETYLEIWWPEGADLNAVTIELHSPEKSCAAVVATHGAMDFDRPGDATCGVVFCKRVAQGLGGTMTLVAVRATRGPSQATPGRWQVTVRNAGNREISCIHAWVERNDLVLGRRRPQGSTLMRPRSQLPARSNMVLASMSNVDRAAEFGPHLTSNYLVVGACLRSDGEVADYSSTGPARGGTRIGPDGLAPGDASAACSGLLVDGPFEGQWSRASGSSAAVAVVTRQLACDFAQGRAPTQSPGRGPGKPPSSENVSAFKLRPTDEDGWFRI
jgi:hypothetical protein